MDWNILKCSVKFYDCFVLPISRNHSLFVLIRLVGINVCIERAICQRSASKSLGGSMSGIFFGERFSLFWAASFDRLENHGICFCRWHFLLFCHQKLYEEGSCGKINMKNKAEKWGLNWRINLLNFRDLSIASFPIKMRTKKKISWIFFDFYGYLDWVMSKLKSWI